MSVKIEIAGETFADAITSLGCPDLIAASLPAETLLAELSERFAADGKVVQVKHWSECDRS